MIALVLAVGVLASLAEPTLQPPRSQSYSTGGSGGVLSDLISTEQGGSGTVTIDMTAMPYDRTVSCTGSRTVTGSAVNATSVTWYAHPAGDSGTCTGTSSWSCNVTVSPADATEAVETITIIAKGGGGQGAVAMVEIGFLTAGANDCWLSQSVDGADNATIAHNNSVLTWVNLVSSSRNIVSGGNSPLFDRTGVFSQPLVFFDGNDLLSDNTASDWTWMHDGTTAATFEVVAKPNSGTDLQALFSTTSSGVSCGQGGPGICVRTNMGSNNEVELLIKNASGDAIYVTSGTKMTDDRYHMMTATNDIAEGSVFVDSVFAAASAAGTYSTAAAAAAFRMGGGNGVQYLTGYVFCVVLYKFELSAAQLDINEAVYEWALGAQLPVVP